MSDWPEGWSRPPGARQPTPPPAERTVILPATSHDQEDAYGGVYEEDKPPRNRAKIIRRSLLVALVLLIVGSVVGYLVLDGRLTRISALHDYEGRPPATPGQDWLLVGSDSRADLSDAERRELRTGSAGGQRTDTMMLLHIPSGGGAPTLVSLPRDSYVPIAGHGRTKLNAAYAFGGPELLVQTVETVTGIRIDHYMEIGFGGFVGIVDAIGGVTICPEESFADPKAGLDIEAGCQVANGVVALGYVRTRATARADLDRVERQREFLAAVMDKAASPGVLLNPFRSVPLALSSSNTVAVDEGTHLLDLVRLGWAMRSDLVTLTVPVAGTPTIDGVGSVVQWDRERALALFDALQADQPPPTPG